MRNIFVIGITVIISLLFIETGYSQKKCTNYINNNCDNFGKPFKYSGQSKNALFEKGQKSLFKITTYNGFEYRVSLCADRYLKGIYFRIREDNTNRTILYDSSIKDDNYLDKMFYVKKTKNLIIEVIVPDGDIPVEEQSYKKRFGCVGVLIEYNKRKDLGFD